MVLFLVGFMGCGKSTAGRKVAERLGYDFVDLDKAIEDSEGRTITQIFEQSGEDEFRRMEHEMLEQVPRGQDIVVATGGGTPCFGDNMALMKSVGAVIYLRTSPEVLLPRLKRGRWRRPKIAAMNDGELFSYITETVAAREEFYMQATLVMDCNGVGDDYIAGHVEQLIRQLDNSK